MIRSKFHIIIALSIVLPMLAPTALQAQRKKKGAEPRGQAMKEREAEFYFTEGEKYFILEDYAKAMLYFQKSLEVSPGNATVHYKMAEILSRSEQQDDQVRAAISIENALQLEKKNKYFYLLAASIYNNLARFDKSAQAYETMMKEVPGTEEYLYDLAAVYQYAKKPEEAIKAYDRAEQHFGVNEISAVQKLRLYLEKGMTKEAMTEGERLMQAYPGEERYIMGFAEVLSKNGHIDSAIHYLEEYIATNDDAANSRMLLAGFYRDTFQEEKARKLLERVFDDPEVELGSKVIILGAYNAELNQNKAKNISDHDKEAFALSLYEKLVGHYPEESDVRIVGGDLYLSTGHAPEAITAYKKAVALGDVNYEVWQNLLYLETQENDFQSVISHSDDALELFPNQPMLYYFQGFAYMRKKKFEEAAMALEQGKKLAAANTNLVSEINSMLGDAYNSLKQYPKSDAAYEAALMINPDNANVLNNYAYYLALRKENLEKAERMSTLLVKNNPDNATYLDTHAWVLYVREKYKEARKVMEKAINTGQANSTHFEHYGDILFKLGDVNGAVAQWEKAKETNANNELLNRKIANRKIYE